MNTFTAYLPAEPAAVWDFLTIPERHNAWSLAHMERIAPGDTDEPGSVGEVRAITVQAFGRSARLREVIEHAEPPHRLVYRVFSGVPIRHHRGEITLVKDGAGTALRWHVEIEFPIPFAGQSAMALLGPQLRGSLARLPKLVRGAPPRRFREPAHVLDEDEVPALFTNARAVLREQEALAGRLEAEDDPRRWFTRVYAYVTESQIDACERGDVTHRAWVLRLIPVFHRYYVMNLRRFFGDAQGVAEDHWRIAFQAMERGYGRYRSPREVLAAGLQMGVRAHIEEDLPRAMAEVYAQSYHGRCGYGRFRADYLLMGGVFHQASERLLARIPPSYLPIFLRLFAPLLPPEATDAFIASNIYNVARARWTAFERGRGLVPLITEPLGAAPA